MADLSAAQSFAKECAGLGCGAILADPPWQFSNRTGKVAPEHRRLSRYETLTLDDIKGIPVSTAAADASHLYLWVPNALLAEGLAVMEAWGFQYKSNIVWHKVRKDGGPDGRGVGFYFRNTTELVLFGIRGKLRTLAPGRRQVNIIRTQKREHAEAGRALRDHRRLQSRSLPGAVCERHSPRLASVGQPGRGLRSGLADILQPQPG